MATRRGSTVCTKISENKNIKGDLSFRSFFQSILFLFFSITKDDCFYVQIASFKDSLCHRWMQSGVPRVWAKERGRLGQAKNQEVEGRERIPCIQAHTYFPSPPHSQSYLLCSPKIFPLLALSLTCIHILGWIKVNLNYVVNTSVLPGKPLVKLKQYYIRDLSGVFSISSLVRISMTSFPAFSLFFYIELIHVFCPCNKKKSTQQFEDMNFIF